MTINLSNDILIYDIECKTFGSPDANKDIMKFFGCYSYKTNKYYLLTNKEDIQKTIQAHKFLVGFNNEGTPREPGYDNVVLKRMGYAENLKYKYMIDLKNIIKGRAASIKIKEGIIKDLIMRYSLDEVTKTLHLVDENTSKLKFDYTLLNKDSWTSQELQLIKDYTIRDLEVTKKLYEFVEEQFWGFREYLTEEDVRKKKYLTSSIAKVTYKAICKAMNWTEEYLEFGVTIDQDPENILGGYVAYPAGEEYHSGEEYTIWVLDFISLYPHDIMMANLFGRKKETDMNSKSVWFGSNVWKTHGSYYTDDMSGVCKLIKQWFNDRLVFKQQKDIRQYTVKIFLNTISGIMETEYYKRVCDKVARKDCTGLGRQWIKYARKVFKQNGYTVVYTDTDSLYLIDPFRDKERMLKVKQQIIDYIKSTVPFPQDTFDLLLEHEIKHLFFFKGGSEKEEIEDLDEDDFINKGKGFLKKNYIYVTTDDEVEVKNLGIRKKSNSPLSRKIFWEYLLPKIKQGQIKFSKTYLRTLIQELLEKDITLAMMRKDVGPISEYSKSPGSIQAQISNKYGAGVHFLIPNLKSLGVGKGKSLCTLEDFKEHKCKVSDIDLDNVWHELSYFIKPPVTVNIFQFEKKNENV